MRRRAAEEMMKRALLVALCEYVLGGVRLQAGNSDGCLDGGRRGEYANGLDDGLWLCLL